MGSKCSKEEKTTISNYGNLNNKISPRVHDFISNIDTQRELDSNNNNIDDKIPWFSFSSKTICSKCVKVCDGNTVHVVANLYDPITGIKQYKKLLCRLSGYETYCLNESNESINKLAEAAKDYLFFLIYNKQIFIQVSNDNTREQLSITVYLSINDIFDESKSINMTMLSRYGIINNSRRPSYQNGITDIEQLKNPIISTRNVSL